MALILLALPTSSYFVSLWLIFQTYWILHFIYFGSCRKSFLWARGATIKSIIYMKAPNVWFSQSSVTTQRLQELRRTHQPCVWGLLQYNPQAIYFQLFFLLSLLSSILSRVASICWMCLAVITFFLAFTQADFLPGMSFPSHLQSLLVKFCLALPSISSMMLFLIFTARCDVTVFWKFSKSSVSTCCTPLDSIDPSTFSPAHF